MILRDLQRAPGIKILGILFILAGFALIVTELRPEYSYMSPRPLMLVFALMLINLGVGLYRLQRWAYLFTIGLCIITLILDVDLYLTQSSPLSVSDVLAAGILAFLALSGVHRKLRPTGQTNP